MAEFNAMLPDPAGVESGVERSSVSIKRVSAGAGKIVERKLRRYIGDSMEDVTALVDSAIAQFIDLDSRIGDYNKEG